jgi:CDP-glucose 4,6-dehydratase
MAKLNTNHFSGAKVIVTGHSGFKGSWLTKLLVESDAKVYGLSVTPPIDRRHIYYELNIGEEVENREDQFNDIRTGAFEELYNRVKPDFVFHLAAQALVSHSYINPAETITTNVIGTLNILESLRKRDFNCTAILITSDKCYKNKNQTAPYLETDELGGDDPYSASKASAEIVIQSYLKSYPELQKNGLASVRAGNVFGGGDWSINRLIPDCARELFSTGKIELRMPNATRPWTYVLDVVSGYMLLASKLRNEPNRFSGSWNFASGENLTVAQIASLFISNLANGEIVINESPIIGHEANLLQIDPEKAIKLLGWNTKKTIEEAMRDTVAWYDAQNRSKNMLEHSKKTISWYI